MGYSTEFKGELNFTTDLTGTQLAKIKTILGEDCRDHPEWNATNLTYISLKLLKDFSGISWDGSEKTYDLVEKINLVIKLMQLEYSEFSLNGKLLAQGEDIDDRYLIVMKNGIAKIEDVVIKDNKTQCPHCGENFYIEE